MEERSIPTALDLSKELIFTTSRSGGAGGQNVNKVNTKVTLKFDVINSHVLDEDQKALLLKKIETKLTKDGVLIIVAQEMRSQLQNKEVAMVKLDQLLTRSFTPRKSRKATKPSKSAKLTRIKNKKEQSEKKQWRKKV